MSETTDIAKLRKHYKACVSAAKVFNDAITEARETGMYVELDVTDSNNSKPIRDVQFTLVVDLREEE